MNATLTVGAAPVACRRWSSVNTAARRGPAPPESARDGQPTAVPSDPIL